jgi:hypothetical protein
MKNMYILLIMSLILCNGCKYFKKSGTRAVDTITADTGLTDESAIDSAALYAALNQSEPVASAEIPGINAGNNRYYMIVGCFTVEQNASKYAEKLRGQGYDAQILAGRDNFQMVSARSYDNYRAGVNELDKFRNEVTPNAWVYRNK